jgi:hypothetical protein
MFDAKRIAGTDFKPNLLIEFLRPPFRKFEFSTLMSPARAGAVLQKIVEPNKIFRSPFSRKHRYFEGRVEGDRFKINRIINYRNSFQPIIEGHFRPESSGTIVTLNMRMIWPVMVFWGGMILLMLWSLVAEAPRMQWNVFDQGDALHLFYGVRRFRYRGANRDENPDEASVLQGHTSFRALAGCFRYDLRVRKSRNV